MTDERRTDDDGGSAPGAAEGAADPADPSADEARAHSSALDDLGAYIRHQRESAKLSLRKLAKLAGVSNPYLSQIERGLRKPSAEILHAIAKALEISSESLYVKAGILEEREPDEDLEAVVRRDPNLTEAQRQAILEMYRSFRRLSAFEDGPPKRRGWLGVVAPGDVDDAAIRAATPREESEDSA